ncbi:MAG TPA: glycerol kinase GlpK [Polyangiaceae bacterium]
MGPVTLQCVQGKHILALDQGTTGTTALVLSLDGSTLGRHTQEFTQHFPRPGWVEHEPEELWQSTLTAIAGALGSARLTGRDIAAIGITNQRETTLLWDRQTCRPVQRAIVWQDRRTSETCRELRSRGHLARVRELTGLVLDPYFSGTKLKWLLDQVPEARARARAGELAFGTVDSYLVMRLAGGAGAPHVADVTNASRTLLMNLERRAWDAEMCALLEIPTEVLPKIVPSAGNVAETRDVPGLPDGIPISGIAGDQHAALYGQACFEVGDVKCTYGTGAFVLVNVGTRPLPSKFGLLSTLGWQIGDDVTYALEGSVFIAGAAVQWLRDGLGIIDTAPEVETLARSVPSSDGVVFVPALAGLGAPYWDAEARGLITGITRGTTKAHVARATLESIAYQVDDLVRAMRDDLGSDVRRMRVDGGAAANDLLMQLQSDFSGLSVERPKELESTARGAAMLAAVGAGLLEHPTGARQMVRSAKTFAVNLHESERQSLRDRWNDAVQRARVASD